MKRINYYGHAFLLELAYECWLRDDAIDWADVSDSLMYFKRNPPEHSHLRSVVTRLGFILTEMNGE